MDGVPTEHLSDGDIRLPHVRGHVITLPLTEVDTYESANVTTKEQEVSEDKPRRKQIEFQIDETPPFHIGFLYAFQIIFINLPGNVLAVFIIHDVLCGGRDYVFMAQLMSSVIFCSGLASLLQVMLGSRLPITQGSSFIFFPPIVAMMTSDEWKCPDALQQLSNETTAANVTFSIEGEEPWRSRLLEVSGGLVAASLVEVFLGLMGIVGLLMRFIGPLTLAPTLMLIGLALYPVATRSCQHQWGVSFLMTGLIILFAVGLGDIRLPIPTWSRKSGFHIGRYPLLRMFSNLLTIAICWLVCYILTVTGCLPDNPKEIGYLARTDAKTDAITKTQWFYIPYPGHFGVPRFGPGLFMGMLAATLSSVMESIGDYYATARTCDAPPPPVHAINRGIAMEGMASVFSGLIGTCHGTTSYSNVMGFIAYTGVASRVPWVLMSIILMAIAVFGKFAGAIATIPEPILGGIALVGLGLVILIGMTQLHSVDLMLTRNQMTLGIALMLGMMMPTYMSSNKDIINTGSAMADQVLRIFLSTGPFVGGITGLILDNLLPGTREERGMIPTEHLPTNSVSTEEKSRQIYDLPFCTDALRQLSLFKYIPVLPCFTPNICACSCASPCRKKLSHKCTEIGDEDCSVHLQLEESHYLTAL